MLLPFYVEKWVLLIDASDKGVFTGINDFLEKLYDQIRINFPKTLSNIFMFNLPILTEFLGVLNPFVAEDLKSSIITINGNIDNEILNYIDENQ